MSTTIAEVCLSTRLEDCLIAALSDSALDTEILWCAAVRLGGAKSVSLRELNSKLLLRDTVQVGRTLYSQRYTPIAEWAASLSASGAPPVQIPGPVWLARFLSEENLFAAHTQHQKNLNLAKEIESLASKITDWGWACGQKKEGEVVAWANNREQYRKVTHPEAGEVFVCWSGSGQRYDTFGTREQLEKIK